MGVGVAGGARRPRRVTSFVSQQGHCLAQRCDVAAVAVDEQHPGSPATGGSGELDEKFRQYLCAN
jgi:hypothetical protein